MISAAFCRRDSHESTVVVVLFTVTSFFSLALISSPDGRVRESFPTTLSYNGIFIPQLFFQKKQIILTNTTGSAKTVTVRLKPANVSEASTHDILSAVTLAANETMSFNCSMVLNNNGSTSNSTNSDQLTALCSSSTSVNISVFGIEEA